MANYYYLISSLPTLKREDTPFYSVKAFLTLCAESLSADELRTLSDLTILPPKNYDKLSGFVRAWYEWENCLRNRLAALRAAKLGRIHKQRGALASDNLVLEINSIITDQVINMGPFEKEKFLDNLRWSKLDSLETGHYFDFDILASYKLKLLIREKWLRREHDKGLNNLNEIVKNIYSE